MNTSPVSVGQEASFALVAVIRADVDGQGVNSSFAVPRRAVSYGVAIGFYGAAGFLWRCHRLL